MESQNERTPQEQQRQQVPGVTHTTIKLGICAGLFFEPVWPGPASLCSRSHLIQWPVESRIGLIKVVKRSTWGVWGILESINPVSSSLRTGTLHLTYVSLCGINLSKMFLRYCCLNLHRRSVRHSGGRERLGARVKNANLLKCGVFLRFTAVFVFPDSPVPFLLTHSGPTCPRCVASAIQFLDSGTKRIPRP